MSSKRVADFQLPDIDAMFNVPPVELDDGEFQCPVCDKKYKTKNGAVSHMNKQDCIEFKHLYNNTSYEIFGAKIFKYILAELKPTAKPTISTFKKSPSYNPVMRFVTFLYHYKMSHMFDNYISWLILRKNAKYMNQILKYGCDVGNLHSFKLDMNALDAVDCTKFIELNFDRLKDDPNYLTYCVEHCHIGVLPLLVLNDFEPIINAMSLSNQERLYDFVDEVLARKAKLAEKKNG